MPLTRFGVSLDKKLLQAFDQWLLRKGFSNRSQALAQLIREGLVTQEWQSNSRGVVGVVTLLYDPGHHILSHTLMHKQHADHEKILSVQHIHLDQKNCLEVIILKGSAKEIQKLSDLLRSLKGIKHSQFVISSSGKDLA
jgi:CopG family nickel-responsive transcriptional regulator